MNLNHDELHDQAEAPVWAKPVAVAEPVATPTRAEMQRVVNDINVDLHVINALFMGLHWSMSDKPGRELVPPTSAAGTKPYLPGLDPLAFGTKLGVVALQIGEPPCSRPPPSLRA